MQKVISFILSVVLFLSSLLPSYAQGIEVLSREKKEVMAAFSSTRAWPAPTDLAASVAKANAKTHTFSIPAKTKEIRQAVHALEVPAEQNEYASYQAMYLAQAKELAAAAMVAQPSQAAQIAARLKTLCQEDAIKQSFNLFIQSEDYLAQSKNAQKEARAYLRDLAHDAVLIAQKQPTAGLPLLRQEFLTFVSLGLVSQTDKATAARFLRADVNAKRKYCQRFGIATGMGTLLARGLNYVKKGSGDWANGWAEGQLRACQESLASAVGLGVVGQPGDDVYNPDSNAVLDLMDEGYSGPLGALVISTGARTLLAMGAQNKLESFLIRAGEKLPSVGLFGSDMSFLSVHDWVDTFTRITGSYAEGLDSSYYVVKGHILGNAWEDLATYLMAYEGSRGQQIVDGVIRSAVAYDRRGNLILRFKPFITGALSAGYQIDTISRPFVGTTLLADGRSVSVDERPNKTAAKNNLRKLGFNETAYAAASLYYSPKNDLNAWTQTLTENKLAKAYRKNSPNGQFLTGMEIKTRPSAAVLSRKNTEETVRDIGSGVDVLLMAFFAGKMALSFVKLGVNGLKTGVRVMRIARLGQAGGTHFSASLQRVVKIARFQKYGVESASGVMANSIRHTLGIKSILPAPEVTFLPQKAVATVKATTYTPAVKEFKAPLLNKTQALEKAKKVRLQATENEAVLKARAQVAARKEARLRALEEKKMISRKMDKALLEQVEEKSKLRAQYEQSDAFLAHQQAVQTRYARTARFNAAVDKWTFGKGSLVLNLVRDRALALNLSLLLNLASPEAAMAARGVSPLRALAQTEMMQTFSSSNALSKTFTVMPGTLRAPPLAKLHPLQVADASKMRALSLGRWNVAGKVLPNFSFSLPEYINLKNLVPGFLRGASTAAPAFSFFTRNTSPLQTASGNNKGGYLYSGFPFFNLSKTAQSLKNSFSASRFQQGSAAQRYAIYGASILGGLEIATPVLTNLGRAFGLSIEDNSLVTLATYLPYCLGAMIANYLKQWIGRKSTLNMGIGLTLAGILSGVFLFGLDGSFSAEVDTMAHFYKILGAITTTSFGSIFIQSSVGPIVTDLSRSVGVERAEIRNAYTQVWRAVGMTASFAFPVIATKLLGFDWSFCFAMPIPLVLLSALAFNSARISNLKTENTAPNAERPATKPLVADANTLTGIKKTIASVKNSQYIHLLKEDPTVKLLIPAMFFMNVIEVALTSSFLYLLPALVPDTGIHGLYGMLQYAIPFFLGRLLAPSFLKWFPKKSLTMATLLSIVGAVSAIPFAQSSVYPMMAALMLSELGTSTLFSLAFARTARNPATQDRVISLIVASAVSCAFGPLLLSKLANMLISAGALGQNAATVFTLMVIPTVLAAISAGLLYKMERTGADKNPLSLVAQQLKHKAIRRAAKNRIQLKAQLKLNPAGYSHNLPASLEYLNSKFKARHPNDLYDLLGTEAEALLPPSQTRVYRGLVVRNEEEIQALITQGMPMSRVTPKTFNQHGEMLSYTPQHRMPMEFSSMCFGRNAMESIPYAFGQGIGARPTSGYVVLAAVHRPADLNTKGVFTLSRNLQPEEVEQLLIYNFAQLKWELYTPTAAL